MSNIFVITVTASPTLYAREFEEWRGAAEFMAQMSEDAEINFIVTDDIDSVNSGHYGDLDEVIIEVVHPD